MRLVMRDVVHADDRVESEPPAKRSSVSSASARGRPVKTANWNCSAERFEQAGARDPLLAQDQAVDPLPRKMD